MRDERQAVGWRIAQRDARPELERHSLRPIQLPFLAPPIMADASQHLTYPNASSRPLPPPPVSTPVASSSKPEVLSDRLYVGNLHPTVDEYASQTVSRRLYLFNPHFLSFFLNAIRSGLLKIFSKCGKVSRLDYLFHKSGPAKGKPRGYAFVEFSDPKVHPCSTASCILEVFVY